MYDKIFWIISDGRSGSTWIAQILNFRDDCHVEMEPVHCDFNERLKNEPLIPGPTATNIDEIYEPLFRDMIAKKFSTERLTPFRPDARNLIVKDINALFIAPAVLNRLPEITPILLVRHPFDVAKSKISLPKWKWFQDVETFLQNDQIRKSLRGLESLVLGANTPFKRHVINWAVGYRFFLDNTIDQPFHLLRYPIEQGNVMKVAERILGIDIESDEETRRKFVETVERRSLTDAPRWSPIHKRLYDRLTQPSPRRIAEERRYAEEIIDAFGLRWIFRDEAVKEVPAHATSAPARTPLQASHT